MTLPGVCPPLPGLSGGSVLAEAVLPRAIADLLPLQGIALEERPKVAVPGRRRTGSTRAFQLALVVKNLPANAEDIRDVCSIPGNTMDRRSWQAAVHRVTQSQIQLQ